MSGMFEQKNDKANRKIAQSQKELKAKKKKKIITITVVIAFLLIAATAITINSGFIRRTMPVVRIDGTGFSSAEFEYFFHAEYAEYMEFMQQFQGMEGAMPDPNRSLSSQTFNSETSETWADFITSMALSSMAELTALNKAAENANFKLSEEQLAQIDNELAMLDIQASMGGFPSSTMLLQRMFGMSMNERVYRGIMEFVLTASHYSEHVREFDLNFTSSQIADYYTANRDELDAINYRQFFVEVDIGDLADVDEDGFEEAAAEAAMAAHTKAIDIADGILSEDDFISAAYEFGVGYIDPDSTLFRMQGGWLEADERDWLLDDSRDFGDITVIESDFGSSILFFIYRDDNNYRPVGMRQILLAREYVNPEDFPQGELDPDFLTAIDLADTLLHERADFVSALFDTTGGDLNALLGLMEEHSDDNTEGGLYTNITKIPYQSAYVQTMRVVPEIENWLFDENRRVGDTEMIFTPDFGYHLVYFTGEGDDIFSELMAEDRMRTRDHNEWLDNLPQAEPVKTGWFRFILEHL